MLLEVNEELQNTVTRSDLAEQMEREGTVKRNLRAMRFGGDSYPAVDVLSLGQLAHEMNSHLDASMHVLRLLQSQLRESSLGSARQTLALSQVGIIEHALQRIAALLHAAMTGPASGIDLLSSARPLHETVRQIIAMYEPLAASHRVSLISEIDPAIADLTTGLLEPLISNGLRRAIESAAAGGAGGQIELCVASGPDEQIVILIAEAATASAQPRPKRPAAGYDSGLDVCGRIVDQLGGRMRVVHVPFGRGEILDIAIPRRSHPVP